LKLLSHFNKYSRSGWLFSFLWSLLFVYGCANIVPPDGGPKDETPPVLLEMSPADSLLNTRVSRIDLRFNKFIEVRDLDKNMQLSPLLEYNPTVMPNGKRVTIKIADSLLEENTTYRISLGNAIVDNRESTPFGNFVYTFSTGAYFDSLQIKGKVIDAATGLPDTAATIVLYTDKESDSAIVRKKPMYVVKANSSGIFTLPSLPGKPFKAYAIYDENANFYYDIEKEKIGFLANTVMPHTIADTVAKELTFYVFKQPVDTAALVRAIVDTALNADSTAVDSATVMDSLRSKPTAGTASAKAGRLGGRKKAAAKTGYLVEVDTLNAETRTQEINKPLKINIYSELSAVDTDKVYLSYDNGGVEVEAIRQVSPDSAALLLNTRWMADKVYTLRLVKGWAKDTAGAELPPGKYVFRTKMEDDYGILRIRINNKYFGNKHLLYVYKGADSVYLQPITDSSVTLSQLKPGEYGMRIIVDENGNGKWDTGDLFARKQPEFVVPYYSSIILKAGWENEIDFLPPEMQAKPVKKKEEPKPEDEFLEEE